MTYECKCCGKEVVEKLASGVMKEEGLCLNCLMDKACEMRRNSNETQK